MRPGRTAGDLHQVCGYPKQSLGRFLTENHPGMPLLEAAHTEVTGTLGQVITGTAPRTRPQGSTVISRPHGLGILDVALLTALVPVVAVAVSQGVISRQLRESHPDAWHDQQQSVLMSGWSRRWM
ncbi:hypothetical protein [Streptomyces sp. SD15]